MVPLTCSSFATCLGPLGCSNKNTIHWVVLINQNLLLTVVEAGNFKIKVLADLLSGENQLPGL